MDFGSGHAAASAADVGRTAVSERLGCRKRGASLGRSCGSPALLIATRYRFCGQRSLRPS